MASATVIARPKPNRSTASACPAGTRWRSAHAITIEPAASALHVRLDVPERDVGEALVREFRQRVDAATLRALEESAGTLFHTRARFADEARRTGAALYRTLVPEGLRDDLRAIRAPLVVASSLTGIPWELVHDGDEFWGLRYALGTRLVLELRWVDHLVGPSPEPYGGFCGNPLKRFAVREHRGDDAGELTMLTRDGTQLRQRPDAHTEPVIVVAARTLDTGAARLELAWALGEATLHDGPLPPGKLALTVWIDSAQHVFRVEPTRSR